MSEQSGPTIDDKLQQFSEFFAIAGEFSINITPVNSAIASYEQFINHIPLPFKMASEISSVDHAVLRSIQGLSSAASHLADFLNYQSQKIDMLVTYILSQQDDEKYRFKGVSFGGGGIVFESAQDFDIGELFELKIFILHANCAVYCIGEVIAAEAVQPDVNHYKVIFHFIREEDREALVRTSLHEQAKQLQALAKQRNQQQ